jgi:DNA mismatch repair protein MutL
MTAAEYAKTYVGDTSDKKLSHIAAQAENKTAPKAEIKEDKKPTPNIYSDTVKATPEKKDTPTENKINVNTEQTKQAISDTRDASLTTDIPKMKAPEIKAPEIKDTPAYEPTQTQPQTSLKYRIVGEVFNAYVIVEIGEKMLLVDKHAAHERVIFEGLKAKMKAHESVSQLLLLPFEVMLTSDEVAVIEEYRREIESVGFEFTLGRNTVSVSAIPEGIALEAVSDMLAVIAERLKSNTGTAMLTRDIIFEKALYQASCKAAIKAGREYPPEYVAWLIERLVELPDITFCPHGRPVAMELSKKKIDHQFERN